MRKAISEKVRFGVLSRDSFTCQYCGRSAPEVVLHVDHIKPFSKGGTNYTTNLITSCESCNRGKGDREMRDKSIVVKQVEEEKTKERKSRPPLPNNLCKVSRSCRYTKWVLDKIDEMGLKSGPTFEKGAILLLKLKAPKSERYVESRRNSHLRSRSTDKGRQ
ncbi:MAG TPA: hypothetical protein DCZ63_09015 [Geobacter sp.]|nr:hypothetical protein [Geobacter sp.]